MTTTGSRLTWERKSRGWSQAEVAERLGTTRGEVGRWERDEIFPFPHFRQKLAALYEKPLAELGLIPPSHRTDRRASKEEKEETPP